MKNIKIHQLKINEVFLQSINDWRKTHEIRYNDRDYQVWDILAFDTKNLYKWDTIPQLDDYNVYYRITHILNSSQFPDWLKDNYVILSILKLKNKLWIY
jgi:hypothetical protein